MLKSLWRLTANNMSVTLEYRGAFLILMFNNLAYPLISLLVWLTVSDQGVALPYERRQFVTYFLMLGLVSMLTSTWAAYFVAENIRNGDLSAKLMRPQPPIIEYIANNIGEKIIKLPLLLPMIAIVALFFGNDLRLPTAPLPWLLFALSLPLAAILKFLIDFVSGVLAFWIDDVIGIVSVISLVGWFLSGQVVPLALFPAGFLPLLEAQPFRYTVSFPLELLTGSLDKAAIMRGFGWQCVYCFVLWLTYNILWHNGLRRYGAAGA